MDFYYFLQVVAAVILANVASFAFFMAAMKCSKLQKQGVKDDALPLWVYACLLAPLGLAGWGVSLLA
ncbi:hypothetical protein [Sulfitobacter sp. 1A12157]|uniref:hypothetical protein n=1 Tax=Sulfitobacter sp. 1A12157 TaxID=3368594 RepID=UPI0037468ED9